MDTLYVAIIAGGRGERFWPLSRAHRPKQFLRLLSGEPLLKLTYDRACSLVSPDRVCIVSTREQADPIRDLIPNATVLAEPLGMNTAPAMSLASKWAYDRSSGATVAVLPSDHMISDQESFKGDVAFAATVAQEGYLTTFGVRPSRVETGYGHIQRGPELKEEDGRTAYRVEKFHEKPEIELARRYTQSGKFYWNSGMFVWRSDAILASLGEYYPEFHHALMNGSYETEKGLKSIYEEAPNISIDYGIMEKTDRAAVVEATFGWEDVGSFRALERALPLDESGNVTRGEVVLQRSNGIVAWADDGMIAAYGVEDLVIVHTKDVTLVLPKTESQRVRDLLKIVRESEDLEKYWK
jgi:mannose-1-phosphate guanylyltransferase